MQGAGEGQQIPGICALIADLGHYSLKVINILEQLPGLFAQHIIVKEELDRVQALLNCLSVRQGGDKHILHFAATHGGNSLVHYLEQRRAAAVPSQGGQYLQVALGSGIQVHKAARVIPG